MKKNYKKACLTLAILNTVLLSGCQKDNDSSFNNNINCIDEKDQSSFAILEVDKYYTKDDNLIVDFACHVYDSNSIIFGCYSWKVLDDNKKVLFSGSVSPTTKSILPAVDDYNDYHYIYSISVPISELNEILPDGLNVLYFIVSTTIDDKNYTKDFELKTWVGPVKRRFLDKPSIL